jgi:hypothetical protein
VERIGDIAPHLAHYYPQNCRQARGFFWRRHSFDKLMVEICLYVSLLGDQDGQQRHAHVLRSIILNKRMLSRLCKTWRNGAIVLNNAMDRLKWLHGYATSVEWRLLVLLFSSRESQQVTILNPRVVPVKLTLYIYSPSSPL